MKTITIIGKGGSGKSTIAANLATVAVKRGFTAGLIDADPQASLSQWRNLRLRSDIKVVPSGDSLQAKIESAKRAGVDPLIIDTAPELGTHTLEAIRSADFVVIPCRPARFDIAVTRARIELMRTKQRRFAIVINAAPPRRDDMDAPFVREVRHALLDVGGRLWKRQITHRHAVIAAVAHGLGVIEYEPQSPASDEYAGLWESIKHDIEDRGHG